MVHVSGLSHDRVMAEQSAEEALAEIRALLDDRVEVEGSDDLTLYERVLDVVASYEAWSELAIRRLHEIHRLKDQECLFCPKWLDTGQQ
jgi:hypothetical protein